MNYSEFKEKCFALQLEDLAHGFKGFEEKSYPKRFAIKNTPHYGVCCLTDVTHTESASEIWTFYRKDKKNGISHIAVGEGEEIFDKFYQTLKLLADELIRRNKAEQ